MSFKAIGSAAVIVVVTMYVISTLATTLNDANTTTVKETIATAFIDGSSLFVLAFIGVVLALGLPKIMNAMK